ncbi:MAG: sulfite reductase subunit alpha [Fibrobacterota bacterium]|nr:sulfite reductase subunit alpha [Fibrobacterota bacterium]QQS04884.1 MAG: sulfite reductase subunit alpha [Fibrobacterota bacterium]
MSIPSLPETAPFTDEQRGWLNGYLAGLFSGGQLSVARGSSTVQVASNAPAVPTRTVRILFGSQSGNAESIAYALGARLKGARADEGRVWAPEVASMETGKGVDWNETTHLVLVSSTWGDGEMPDNGKAFWSWLSSEAGNALSKSTYSVLGIGDRNYARFCAAGRQLDARMEALGAKRLLPLELLDTDYEQGAKAWCERIAGALGAADSTEPTVDAVKPQGWSKSNPFPAPMLENRRLNSRESEKDTRHIALSLAGSGLTYRAGDALGVWPVNHFELVDSLVIACNAHGSETVSLADGQLISFRAALLTKLDLFRPKKSLLEALFASSPSQGDRRRLRELLAVEGEMERTELLGESDVLDILWDFPTARLEPQTLVDNLRKIIPRLYSISSSPLAHPNEVHLTVGIHRTRKRGRDRFGVASSFLASRVPLGLPANVFVQPSGHFHPPEDPSRDLIMCGPGTGIAPFRGFLHERAATGATGRNWLFFGEQRRETDFLYRDELLALRSQGVLTELDLAFSRDQEEKIYVQNRMLERAKDLWSWLEGGATFCVCGDAKRMAKDVHAALRSVCEIGGGLTTDQADAYLTRMQAEQRYLRDVY